MSKVLEICCRGDPKQIGFQHGKAAAKQVVGSIKFYAWLFEKYTGRNWSSILPIAEAFGIQIKKKWPRFYGEIEGVALGSGQSILDIIALNVRTEIAFGLLSSAVRTDGCTTVAWRSDEQCYLGQNWDWMEEQKENLVLMTVVSPGFPTIKMVTEGGIIGKIGLNECGVGVCLNAIRSRGMSKERLPVHLALRLALEATSAEQAGKQLEAAGVAGSAHILVADAKKSIGLEFTSKTCIRLKVDDLGRVLHTNHMLGAHEGIEEMADPDSFSRLRRVDYLTRKTLQRSSILALKDLDGVFDDHEGFPASICRAQEGCSEDATVFNMVMDLRDRMAVVKLGRPCAVQEEHVLSFDHS